MYVNNYLQSEHAHSADFKSPAKLRYEVDNTAGKIYLPIKCMLFYNKNWIEKEKHKEL